MLKIFEFLIFDIIIISIYLEMTSKFTILKKKFNEIKLNDNILIGNFKTIEQNIDKYDIIYNNIFSEYQHRKLVIGLDEFYFQKHMLINEKNTLINFYDLIVNRMYADYFKMSKSIKNFLKEIKIHKLINPFKNHLQYNYIQLTDKYTLKQVEELFIEIVSILEKLNEVIINDEFNFLNYKKNRDGLNINNFLISFDSEIQISKNKINVFYDYLEYYLFLHNDYFNKVSQKINLTISLYNVNNKIEHMQKDIIKKKETFNDTVNEKQNMFMNIQKPNFKILQSLQSEVIQRYRVK